jgi:hypothetical protein
MNDQEIRDRCPACGHATLFVGQGGWLKCSWLPCREPGVGRVIASLQAQLVAVGKLPSQLHEAERHVCMNCDLDDEERARRDGFNEGIRAAVRAVKEALSLPARLTDVESGKAIGSATQTSTSLPQTGVSR